MSVTMDINQTEDLKLLAQLENDNEKAFDHLFAKYYPGLIRFCKSLLNSSGDEAEDVVQEIFLKLWQQRKNGTIHTALNAFLYISVKNKVNDHFRRRHLTTYAPLNLVEEKPMDDYLAPDHLLMYKELDLDINQMISLLPERTELVFRMNRNDYLSYTEIAEMLNISIHSVKTHMYRAIKFLKENFRHYNSPF